jgi:D-alanine-D-alanine ligase
MPDTLNVLLLAGGDSAERDVSLASARSILHALETLGHRVHVADPMQPDLSSGAARELVEKAGILAKPPVIDRLQGREAFMRFLERWSVEGTDVIFNALHGGAGEDGTIQAMLEYLGIPFTGSGATACAVAMNKHVSRSLAAAAGVPVAHGFQCNGTHCSMDELKQMIDAGPGFPAVVKPLDQGSSVGLSIVKDPRDLAGAVGEARRYGERFIVERYIAGSEITVSILGEEALPVLEIRPTSGVYDYLHKYTSGVTEYIVPAPIGKTLSETFAAQAVAAYRALGCCVYARADFRLSEAGEPFLLEMNTLPGMTEHSLVPKAARAAGIEFAELVDRIIRFSLREVRSKH